MSLLSDNGAIPPTSEQEVSIRQHMADALGILLANRVAIEQDTWFDPDFSCRMGTCAYVQKYVIRHLLPDDPSDWQYDYKRWGIQNYIDRTLQDHSEQWSEFSGSHPYPVGLSNQEAVDLYSQRTVSEFCMDEDDPAILAEWLYEMVSTDTHKSMYGINVYGLARWRLIDHWYLHITTSLNSDSGE